MLWECKEGCQVDQPKSKGHPGECEKHGRTFAYTKALGSKPRQPRSRQRKPMRRVEPKRDWTDARAKVDEAHCCRICKRTDRPLEAAHILGREHDEPKVSKSTGEILQELYVDPDRIIPACGPFPEGCHGLVHQKAVDLLQFLTLSEEIRAVKDAGGVQHVRTLLAPLRHREEVEESAYVPDEDGAVARA